MAKAKASRKKVKTAEEKREEKNLLSRKSVAYQKARAQALKNGADETTAKEAGRKACSDYILYR